MKVPLSAVMALGDMVHPSPLRPKHFIVMSISSKSGDIEIKRYVRSWPCLLRVRLFLAKRKLIKAYRKLEAFRGNHGI